MPLLSRGGQLHALGRRRLLPGLAHGRTGHRLPARPAFAGLVRSRTTSRRSSTWTAAATATRPKKLPPRCARSPTTSGVRKGLGPMTTLLIDNYDSFTYNLYQYLEELGAETVVYRNDAVTLEDCRALAPGPRRDFARPGHTRRSRHLARRDPRVRGQGAGAGRLPRPPVHLRGVRRHSRRARAKSSTARSPPSNTTARASSRGCPKVSTPPATIRWPAHRKRNRRSSK